MMERRKVYGPGSKRLFRVLLACSLLLSSALLPLGAWPMLQAEEEEEMICTPRITVTTTELTAEEQPQSEPSGTVSKDTSEEPSRSLGKAQEGKRLSGDEALELYLAITEAADEAKAARASSEAKSAEIAELKARLAKAEEETGSKPYLMLDGIVAIDDMIPQYGVGLTVGSRIGNSLMVEVGADYMIGGNDGYNSFSLDNFQFRAGVGWMF